MQNGQNTVILRFLRSPQKSSKTRCGYHLGYHICVGHPENKSMNVNSQYNVDSDSCDKSLTTLYSGSFW